MLLISAAAACAHADRVPSHVTLVARLDRETRVIIDYLTSRGVPVVPAANGGFRIPNDDRTQQKLIRLLGILESRQEENPAAVSARTDLRDPWGFRPPPRRPESALPTEVTDTREAARAARLVAAILHRFDPSVVSVPPEPVPNESPLPRPSAGGDPTLRPD